MQIISAARQTGKSTYCKALAEANKNTLVVVPKEFMKHTDHNNQVSASYLLDCMKYGKALDWGCYWYDFNLIFEEPAFYDKQFIDIMEYIENHKKGNILLVIGTPVGKYNCFDMWLAYNKKDVTKWIHADSSRFYHPYMSEERRKTEIEAKFTA